MISPVLTFRVWTVGLRYASFSFRGERRSRLQQAGLPVFGGNRRVSGLRREEVALLAGVSSEYYARLERGNLAGVSDTVLETVAGALQLDEAERETL